MSYTIRFGAFELDIEGRVLRKSGMRVRLGGQPMEILLLLAGRPGEVVSRDELRQRLWPGDQVVDFDVGLSTAMRKLRDALRDTADRPRFIETLPRRGYRFIAPVVRGEPPPTPPRRFDRTWIIAAALVVIAAAAALLLRPKAEIRSVAVVPFENLTGDASMKPVVDSVTNRLANRLGLRVIPRTSTSVDAIVTGSVSKGEISVQLITASTGQLIWAQRYQSESQMARDVAVAIRKAGGQPSHARRPPS